MSTWDLCKSWDPVKCEWVKVSVEERRRLRRIERVLHLGLPQSAASSLNDWSIALLEGPESAVRFAFNIYPSDKKPKTFQWLLDNFKRNKIKTDKDLYTWSNWFSDIHPIDRMEKHFEEEELVAFTLQQILEFKKRTIFK